MSAAQQDQEKYPPVGYAWYVIGVLTIAYIFSFIDRQIISIIVSPIKRDLNITDTQISLLMGPCFAVFYTLFGIPLGWLADRKSRRGLIFWGIAFWSLMTAGCGLAQNYWQLALLRIGVGVGEAALSPAAYSLIADYFPPQRRSTAMSVYTMGIYVGSGLAFILGGAVAQMASKQAIHALPVLGEIRSWQIVFLAVGLPGVLVALLLLTVKEPSRHQNSTGSAEIASGKETWNYLWANRWTFLWLNLGVAFITLSSYANTSWVPQLFIRRYQWDTANTGLIYGLIVAFSGFFGVVSAGWLADRWLHKGKQDAQVRVAFLACLCGLPCAIAFPLAGSGVITALLLIPMVFFGSAPFGVAPAAIQRMMPRPMRAQATAIYLFMINIIGMALGPLVLANLMDYYFKDAQSIHISLFMVGSSSYVVALVCLAISLKNYRQSLSYLQNWTETQAARSVAE